MSDSKLDPILPIYLPSYDGETTSSILLDLKRRFAFRRFLLVAPGLGVRLTGFPDSEIYRQFGETLLAIKSRVSDDGIEVGWWCAPSFKSGQAEYQRITGIDGSVSEISSCPMDEEFREVFPRNVAIVAEIAKPFLIQFEDDFELSNHGPVRFGCFCPLHLQVFAARVGRQYTREELIAIFSEVNAESISLRRQWAEMSRDTLAAFAGRVRKQVDTVSPETRISLCQAGCCDFDGDFTSAVASAFAGNTRPFVRVHGSTYSSDDAESIPGAIFNVHYSKESLPEHFELVHESDTYPHTRFFMSAAKLKSLIAGAFSYGMHDSLLYATQYLDDPAEESRYSEMFLAESKRFAALRDEVEDCHPQGCEICYSPWSHTAVAYNSDTGAMPATAGNPWVGVLGKMGIPYSVRPGKVKMLAGHHANILSDDEIRQLLSTGLMMDGKAAYILAQRGYGDLIGADVSVGGKCKVSSERIEDTAGFTGIRGKLMYNFIFAPAGSEGGSFFVLSPKPETEVLTSFCEPSGKAAMPGMTRFENALGGRVAITAFDLLGNRSSSVFNYRKKEVIRQTIEWLGREPLPVFVKNLPNVFCICNGSDSGDKTVVTLINLCSDPADSLELVLPSRWQSCRMDVLNPEGQWDRLQPSVTEDVTTVPIRLNLMEPQYLKFTRG